MQCSRRKLSMSCSFGILLVTIIQVCRLGPGVDVHVLTRSCEQYFGPTKFVLTTGEGVSLEKLVKRDPKTREVVYLDFPKRSGASPISSILVESPGLTSRLVSQ